MPEAWLIVGAVVFLIGFAAMVVFRRSGSGGSDRSGSGAIRVPLLGAMSRSALLTLGLSLMFGGYHLVAYLGPSGLLVLHVRRDLWWLVIAGCVVAVVGAVIGDRLLGEDETLEAEELGPEQRRM